MIELTLPPSRVIRASAFAVRWLWRLLLALFLLLSLAWGALQFWIVPRIADLRPRLETLASEALGVPVRLASIEARPGMLVPSFELQGVQLLDASGREVLRLPRVVAALSAASLLRFDFEQLYVEKPVLEVRRTVEGRILVAGLDFSKDGGEGDAAAADWFFSLPEFVIQGATVRWLDERRDAGPLALTAVNVVFRNGPRRHDMRIDATPPDGWGQRFTLMGKFRRPLLSTHAGRWADWDGQVYASFSHVDLSRLRRYVSLGPGVDVREGEGGLRAWVDISRGVPLGGTADLALSRVTATLGPGLDPLDLRDVTGRLGGKLLASGFQLYTEGLQFTAQDGLRWPGGNVSVTHTLGEGRLPAVGDIRADRLDLLALARIAGSLPLGTVTHEALRAHPVKGLIESFQARWQGPLSAPMSYELRARASGLDVAALPAVAASSPVRGTVTEGTPPLGLPGVRGATVDVDMNQNGGRARLVVTNGALVFPGVFEDPLLPMDQFSADARWQIQGERIVVNQFRMKLANADAQGEFTGNWQTGGPGRTRNGARFPGVLDLQGQFVRADGARVHRYLPLGIPAPARHYVRDAIVKATLSGVNVRVKGELARVPFADAQEGEFRFSGNVKDATYVYVPEAIAPRGQLPWPELRELGGVLVFDRGGMRVQGASARLTGQPGLRIDAVEASLPDFVNKPTVIVGFDVKGPAREMVAVVNGSPLGVLTGRALERATVTGDAAARVKLTVPIDVPENTRVLGSVTFAGNDLRVSPDTPLLSRARGVVSFSDAGFSLSGAQARIYGGDARIEGGTRPVVGGGRTVWLRAQGSMTAEGLRQARELGYVAKLANQATGSTSYSAVLGVRRGLPEVLVTSNLQGLALNLPAPFGKAAETVLPLKLESVIEPDTVAEPRVREHVQCELGSLASASYVREREGNDTRVLRGSIAVGLTPQESAPQPAQGVAANIHVAELNLDVWESLLSGTTAPSSSADVTMADSSMLDYLPTSLALRAGKLVFGGRSFNDVVVGGAREHLTWRGNISATQLNGHVEYRQSSGAGDGRLYARLARLVVPREATAGMETLLDQQPSVLPALDVMVDDFELRGRKLGRLEIQAVNRVAAPGQDATAREWRLSKLNLTTPEATLSATGNWAVLGAQSGGGTARSTSQETPVRRTAMKFSLELADAGALLERLGMKDVIRRGKGRMEGMVTWNGSPTSPDYPTMGGQINVSVENGQFLKADPGLAKLLGVLSLQALPRRLTLDFRDVFSDGFSFDFVRGDMAIARGVATTNNLQMKGVNAAVLMDGRADLVHETQDVRVIIVPEINAGTASLVATVINPAIGLGSVLAQLFLRRPLIKAATQEFHVDGSWSDPRVTRVTTNSDEPDESTVKPEAAQQ